MPQIPVFTARVMPEATPQQGINPAAVAAPYQQIAAAGERAATMFGELAAATRKAQSAQELIAARTVHATRLAELRADLETNPDLNPADIRTRWDAGRAEISRDILGTMRDRTAQRDFRLAAAGVEAGELSGVVRLQATRTAEVGRADLSRRIDSLSDLAAAARDPGERGRILGQIEGSIGEAVQKRYLAADDAEKLRQRSLGRLDNAAVIGLIRQNPVAALAALGDPARFSNLDPVQRERLANTATSAMSAAATAGLAAETRAARVQRENADRAANDLWARVGQARLGNGDMPTVPDVQRQREWLSPGETRALVDAVSGRGAREDDPMARVDLTVRVDSTDPATFAADVQRAVRRGELTSATAASLITANRAARRDDQPPSPIAAGRRFLVTTLDPRNVPMSALMMQQLSGQLAAGEAEYDRWSAGNPNASREEAVTMGRRIVAATREAAAPSMRDALPLPFGYSGSRIQVTPETLSESARKLLRSGLPAAEIIQQQQRIDDWQQILTLVPPPARTETPRPAAPAAGARGTGPSNRPAQ